MRNKVNDPLGELVAALVERGKPRLRERTPLVRSSAVGRLLGQATGQHTVSRFGDVLARFRDLRLAIADTGKGKGNLSRLDLSFPQLVGKQDRRFQIVQRKASRKDGEQGSGGNLKGASRGVGRPIQDQQVVMTANFEGLFDGAEPFDGNSGFNA